MYYQPTRKDQTDDVCFRDSLEEKVRVCRFSPRDLKAKHNVFGPVVGVGGGVEAQASWLREKRE